MGHLQHIQQASGNSSMAPSGNVIGTVGRVNHNTNHTARNAQFNSDSNTHSPINNSMHQRMMPVNNGNGVTLHPPHAVQVQQNRYPQVQQFPISSQFPHQQAHGPTSGTIVNDPIRNRLRNPSTGNRRMGNMPPRRWRNVNPNIGNPHNIVTSVHQTMPRQ